MVEGFWLSWGRYLFNWYGFTFTVAGTIIGLVLAKEHWWISVLIVITAFLASCLFAFRAHWMLKEAEKRFESEKAISFQRLQDAENKLNDVPYEFLARLQSMIATHSFTQLGQIVGSHAEFIERMKGLTQASPKPINLRTFTRQGGNLFAVAKAPSTALQYIRTADAFLLIKKSTDGLETPCARLVVHQPPDPAKEVVMFQISEFQSDEMGHIDNLARTGDVDGIKGFGIRLASDVAAYKDLDLRSLPSAITRLVQDIARDRKV